VLCTKAGTSCSISRLVCCVRQWESQIWNACPLPCMAAFVTALSGPVSFDFGTDELDRLGKVLAMYIVMCAFLVFFFCRLNPPREALSPSIPLTVSSRPTWFLRRLDTPICFFCRPGFCFFFFWFYFLLIHLIFFVSEVCPVICFEPNRALPF